jgi:hypothetical protein
MRRAPTSSTPDPAARGDAASLTSIRLRRDKLPPKGKGDALEARDPVASPPPKEAPIRPVANAPQSAPPPSAIPSASAAPPTRPAAPAPQAMAALPPPRPRAPLPALPPTPSPPPVIVLPAPAITPPRLAAAEPPVKADRAAAPEPVRPPAALAAARAAPRDAAPMPQPKALPKLELVATAGAPRSPAPVPPKPKPEPAAGSVPGKAAPPAQAKPQAKVEPVAAPGRPVGPVPRVPKTFGAPAPAGNGAAPRGDREFVLYWQGLRRGTAMPKLALLDREFVAGCWPDSLMVSYAGAAGAPQIARLGRTTGEIEYTPMVTEWIMACAREVARRGEALEDVQEFPLTEGVADYHLLLLPFAAPDGKSEHVLCHLSRA